MRKLYLLCLNLLVTINAHAFPCFITVAKDSCWTNYDVTVRVIDAHTNQQFGQIILPKGKSVAVLSFQCDPSQVFMLNAQFSPIIWQNDAGKMYSSQSYLTLPSAVKPGEVGWNFSTCYPSDFAGVPMPPTATNSCKCDFSSAPKPTL